MNAADLKAELTEKIESVNDLGQLDEVRVSAFGKKGKITELMKSLGGLPADDRKEQAIVFNDLKNEILSKLESNYCRLQLLKKAFW